MNDIETLVDNLLDLEPSKTALEPLGASTPILRPSFNLNVSEAAGEGFSVYPDRVHHAVLDSYPAGTVFGIGLIFPHSLLRKLFRRVDELETSYLVNELSYAASRWMREGLVQDTATKIYARHVKDFRRDSLIVYYTSERYEVGLLPHYPGQVIREHLITQKEMEIVFAYMESYHQAE